MKKIISLLSVFLMVGSILFSGVNANATTLISEGINESNDINTIESRGATTIRYTYVGKTKVSTGYYTWDKQVTRPSSGQYVNYTDNVSGGINLGFIFIGVSSAPASGQIENTKYKTHNASVERYKRTDVYEVELQPLHPATGKPNGPTIKQRHNAYVYDYRLSYHAK